MAQDTPSRDLEKIIIRLPDGMRDRLKDEATKNNRSLNAEVVARLEHSMSPAFQGIEPELLESLPRFALQSARATEKLLDQSDRLFELLDAALFSDEAREALKKARSANPLVPLTASLDAGESLKPASKPKR